MKLMSIIVLVALVAVSRADTDIKLSEEEKVSRMTPVEYQQYLSKQIDDIKSEKDQDQYCPRIVDGVDHVDSQLILGAYFDTKETLEETQELLKHIRENKGFSRILDGFNIDGIVKRELIAVKNKIYILNDKKIDESNQEEAKKSLLEACTKAMSADNGHRFLLKLLDEEPENGDEEQDKQVDMMIGKFKDRVAL